MTERDAFEGRLRAALLRHVADGPTDFDALGFARAVAAKEPRRHGFAAALTWPGVAVPRVAWLLLLLLGLLVALVAGMLVVGSQPVRKLPTVVPPIGQVFACPPGSTSDKPGPADQARPPQYSNVPTAAFNRRAGRLVALVVAGTAVETWTFDVCANTWTQMHPDREPPAFERASLIYDIDSDVSILVTSQRVWVSSPVESHTTNLQPYSGVWAYDLQADTWTEKGAAPIDATLWNYAMLWAYDPRSGRVVAALGPDLWSYDVETDTWTPIHQTNSPGDTSPPYAVYDASVDRFIIYGPWRLDIRTGTWSMSAAVAPTLVAGFGWQAPKLEYDEAAQRTVVFANDQLALYDATADRWETLNEADHGGSLPLSMVYDPVNRRLIGWRAHPFDPGDVIAFDLVTRERTVLLEPSDVRPVPSSE